MLYLPTCSLKKGGGNINNLDEEKIISYGKDFDEHSFWSKLIQNASSLGEEGVLTLLLLFYALRSEIPTRIKAIILGAICYFIIPADVCPDFIPILGMADDLTLICFSRYKAQQYIDVSVKDRAYAKLKELKGAIS